MNFLDQSISKLNALNSKQIVILALLIALIIVVYQNRYLLKQKLEKD
jgi:hypothetical protein